MMDWLESLQAIARNAAAAVKPMLGTPEAGIVLGKGAGGDKTKQVDDIAEKIILEGLHGLAMPMKVITEERGTVFLNKKLKTSNEKSLVHAIVDPIDGSYNATRGFPAVGISIAIASGGCVRDLEHAIVLNVSTGDEYTASKGKGAFLNGTRIPTNAPRAKTLEDAAVGIDLNPKSKETTRSEIIQNLRFFDKPRKIRVLGSNAIATCLVATGALDCLIDVKGNMRLLDIAGGILMVRESGGDAYEWRDGKLVGLDDASLDLQLRFSFVAVGNQAMKHALEQV